MADGNMRRCRACGGNVISSRQAAHSILRLQGTIDWRIACEWMLGSELGYCHGCCEAVKTLCLALRMIGRRAELDAAVEAA